MVKKAKQNVMKKQFSIRFWFLSLLILGATITSCSYEDDMEMETTETVISSSTTTSGSPEETGEEEELEPNS